MIDEDEVFFFRAHVNMFIGFIAVIWIATPIFYYSNIWDAKKMPIISNRVFDTDGYFYDINAVLDENLRLNETAYHAYSKNSHSISIKNQFYRSRRTTNDDRLCCFIWFYICRYFINGCSCNTLSW